MNNIKAVTELLQEHLGENQNHVVFLLEQTPQGTKTAYSSGLERTEALRFLVDMVVSMRRDLEPRVMGEGLDAVPDLLKIAMFEAVETVKRAFGSRVSEPVWRDMLLVLIVGMAHDQGVTRADFERVALELAEEEWSTPSTEGRKALDHLVKNTKPSGG